VKAACIPLTGGGSRVEQKDESVCHRARHAFRPPTTALQPVKSRAATPDQQPSFWLWVFCLLGVDCFSTLSYQPSITYQVAGPFGPLATGVVVFVTLLLVLPLYMYMARQSPHGEGSIAVLDRLIGGWAGKTLILVVLGFAATDFLMLRSISLSDAAEHVRYNSYVRVGGPLYQLAETIRASPSNCSVLGLAVTSRSKFW